MCSVVKVCAGKLFAVAKQNSARTATAPQKLTRFGIDDFVGRITPPMVFGSGRSESFVRRGQPSSRHNKRKSRTSIFETLNFPDTWRLGTRITYSRTVFFAMALGRF